MKNTAQILVKPKTPIQINNLEESSIKKEASSNKNETSKAKSKRAIFNIRGIKYEIPLNSLDKLPNSRLGKIKTAIESITDNDKNPFDDLCDDYDTKANEFYFNRDPYIFNMILNYYSSDKLHIENGHCPYLFSDELAYWKLDEFSLNDCCDNKHWKEKESIDSSLQNEKEILIKYNKRDRFGNYLFPRLRERIWIFLEEPDSSWYARVNCINIFIILILKLF